MTASIGDFLSPPRVDLPGLSRLLDEVDPVQRVRMVSALGGREQAVLFEAAEGFRPARLVDLVPEDVPPFREVIHYGRNSLRVLNRFQKRFYRPGGANGVIWGYNEFPLKKAFGPGYFAAREAGAMEVRIDYSEIPAAKPDEWPRILPSSARLGRFVYADLQDTLRGVSRHVTVGRAARRGQTLDNWFVLCRATDRD